MPRARLLTRIAIVEDHALFAEALDVALTLEGHEVFRLDLPDSVVALNQLVSTILRHRPRIVLLDLDLGAAGDGVRLVEPLTRAGVAVVVVTATIEPPLWGECLSRGARTVLPKSAPLNTILATIRHIGEGRRVIDRDYRDSLVQAHHDESQWARGARARLDSLTNREREVLSLLMTGRTVREIARESFVSEATVRTQVKSILAKLDVSSQLAAVGTALKAHWRPTQSSGRASS